MQAARQQLRQQMRQQRRALSPVEQLEAGQGLLQQAQQLDWADMGPVALFLSHDGEPDTRPLIEWLWQQEICTCLPVLHPFSYKQLLFLRFGPDCVMAKNKYGIEEPRLDVSQIIPLSDIERMLMPLTAFDARGHRLGMGAGYYDRTLAPSPARNSQPECLGLAHDSQEVAEVPVEPWDMPLDGILTPTRWINPSTP